MKQKIEQVKLLEFPQRRGERGHLVAVEGEMDLPFEFKRAFYVYASDSKVLGGEHANRKTKFVLINVSGTSKVKIRDFNGDEQLSVLDRPDIEACRPKTLWDEMYDFSEDSVLASKHYDDSEYIRNNNAYVKEFEYE